MRLGSVLTTIVLSTAACSRAAPEPGGGGSSGPCSPTLACSAPVHALGSSRLDPKWALVAGLTPPDDLKPTCDGAMTFAIMEGAAPSMLLGKQLAGGHDLAVATVGFDRSIRSLEQIAGRYPAVPSVLADSHDRGTLVTAFGDALVVDPGAGETRLQGGGLLRLDSSGRVSWFRRFSFSYVLALKEAQESIWMVVQAADDGGVTFDSGEKVSGNVLFLVVLDLDGKVRGTHVLGSTIPYAALSFAGCDGIVLAGMASFTDQPLLGADLATKMPAGGHVFLARFTLDGALAWAHDSGNVGIYGTTALAAQADGTFVLAGYLAGRLDNVLGEPGSPDAVTLPAVGDGKALPFTAAFTADGRLRWVRRIFTQDNIGSDHVVPAPDGGVIRVGTTTGTDVGSKVSAESSGGASVDLDFFDPGRSSMVVVRYDADGRLLDGLIDSSPSQLDTSIPPAVFPDGSVLVGGMSDSDTPIVFGRGRPGAVTVADTPRGMYLACYGP